MRFKSAWELGLWHRVSEHTEARGIGSEGIRYIGVSFGVVVAAHLFVVPSVDLDWVLVASALAGLLAGFPADITDRIVIEKDNEDDGPEVYASLGSVMVVLAVVQDGLSTAGFIISGLLMYAAAYQTSDFSLTDLRHKL